MFTAVKVCDERENKWVEFERVGVGCWFVDEYGDLYCKLTNEYDCENALSANGDKEEFAPDDFTKPIKKLTFTIKE